MKNKNKNHSFLITGVVSLLALFVGVLPFANKQESAAAVSPVRRLLDTRQETYSEEDFASDAAPADFSIEIKSATSTPRSKRVKVSFASKAIEGMRDATGLFYIVVDDVRYSGNSSNPVANPDDFAEGEEIVFNGYTISVDPEGTPTATDIFIPEYLRRGQTWKVKNLSIVEHAGTTYGEAKNIYIPQMIETVAKDAFINVPNDVTFYVEHASKPEGWDDEWCDGGQVVWGYTGIPANKKSVARNSSTRQFGEVSDYYLGYVDETNEEYNKPLVVSYNVTDKNGQENTKWEVLPIESTINHFDGIGLNLGKNSLDRNIELDFEEGETLDYHSITFYNIYPIVSETDKKPDLTKPYHSVAKKKFDEEYHIANYLKYRFEATSTFLGYTAVTMYVDKVNPSPYLTEMEAVYNEKIDFINSGRYVLRYAFYNLSACVYEARYMHNGEIVESKVKVKTPITAFSIDKDTNNQITFLIKNSDVGKGFDVSKLKEFDISGLTLNMHLFDLENNVKVGRTETTKTFGLIEVKPASSSLKLFSIDVFYAIIFPVYFLIYAAVCTVLYFVLREKNKNDEFKRMKTKPFIIKSVISGVCSSIVLLAVLSIILRLTAFNNSITVFNPLDVFIVFAGILSVIIIGYFIRYVYISIKNNLHRRQVLRLKLNQNNDDDGTN